MEVCSKRLLSGPCKPMGLDNSPEPFWLPRKVPMRVPENPALLLLGGALVLADGAALPRQWNRMQRCGIGGEGETGAFKCLTLST